MGVYIKGLKTPQSGQYVFVLTSSGMVENINGLVVGEAVEVKVPHGRIGDLDAIYDAVERRYCVSSGAEHKAERDFLDLITSAPTIIEVEE